MNKMVKDRIFKNEDIYITSKFGNRTYTLNGKQISDFHNGVDYGTNLKKLPQYAIEKGKIRSIGRGNSSGKYIYVDYPRLNKTFFHAHLDSISVKQGQTVDNNTIIGFTGKTGQATGIHLHLGMFPIGDWNKAYYSRNWEDVEKYVYPEKTIEEIAQEVINGKWDNYPKRKTLLENAGYNYSEVQKLVNEILKETKKEIVYVVKKGDTLNSIAKKYNTTWQTIYNNNKKVIGTDPNLIKPGQKLKI